MTGIFKKIVQVLLKSNSKLNASDIFLGICMLLIGGIGFLKGYDLILEARVRNLADQAIKIQSSYYRFIDFYRHIPGDWMAEEAALSISDIENGGNGNGFLDLVDGDPWKEPLAVWEHLFKANLLDVGYIKETTLRGIGKVRAPVNAFGAPMILFSTSGYFDISSSPPKRLGLMLGRGIPVTVLAKLDKKIDDGYPASGLIRYVGDRSNPFGKFSTSASECVDASQAPPVWFVQEDAQDCNAIHLY